MTTIFEAAWKDTQLSYIAGDCELRQVGCDQSQETVEAIQRSCWGNGYHYQET